MSMAILNQVQEDVRRIAIAGAAVAGGDFRLKKLLPALEQAGTKAPIFARVAQAVQAVVDSNEKNASVAVLDLASLVNAILYTQGETGAVGEWRPIPTTDLGGSREQTSARTLKPLLEALTSTGSGRIELVRDAVERGTFRDLRLVRPALQALDDPYPEIASLLAEKVLPMYGKAIVPALRDALDLKGLGGDVHRLRLLHRLDPEGTRELVRQALDAGSKEIRVAAIGCLDTTGSDLGFLLEQARSRAKDVRAAALRALGTASNAVREIVSAIKAAIDGDDIELIVDTLKETKVSEVQDYVVARGAAQLAEVLKQNDAKKQGTGVTHLMLLIRCLDGRTDAPAEALLGQCFESVGALEKVKSSPSGADFNELLARVMLRGSVALQQRLAQSHASMVGEMIGASFAAARNTMSPAAFYKEFSPILAKLSEKRGKKSGERERADALVRVLSGSERRAFHRSWVFMPECHDGKTPSIPELDPRWLDVAIDTGNVELICDLARPGHGGVGRFIMSKLETTKLAERYQLLATLVRIRFPGAADAIIDALKQHAKAAHHGYNMYSYAEMIAELPRSEAPKFEALLTTLPEAMVDHLIASVITLKSKPE
jgi:hypothetical protein